jgi:hypothetical protein
MGEKESTTTAAPGIASRGVSGVEDPGIARRNETNVEDPGIDANDRSKGLNAINVKLA